MSSTGTLLRQISRLPSRRSFDLSYYKRLEFLWNRARSESYVPGAQFSVGFGWRAKDRTFFATQLEKPPLTTRRSDCTVTLGRDNARLERCPTMQPFVPQSRRVGRSPERQLEQLKIRRSNRSEKPPVPGRRRPHVAVARARRFHPSRLRNRPQKPSRSHSRPTRTRRLPIWN